MDYRTSISRILIASLLSFTASECVIAQSVRAAKPAGTPSHRHLPLKAGQTAPKLNDFKSPELDELVRQYTQIRREKRANQPRVGSQRLPGESNRDWMDRERNLQQQLSQQIPRAGKDEIEEQIQSLSEELGRRLGGALAESMKSDSIPFDPNNKTSFWDKASEIRNAIREQQEVAKSQYRQAMEQYKQTWPADSVAPEEWMQKVQPFINSEVIEQLAEASRQFEAQKHLPPEQRSFTGFPDGSPLVDETGRKSGMIDSMMTSIGQQSVEWLKSASKDKNSNSFFKSLSQGAKNSISKMNRKMTENSRRGSKNESFAPKSSSSPLISPLGNSQGAGSSGGATSPSGNSNASPTANTAKGFPWWGLLVVVAIVAPSLFFLRRRIVDADESKVDAVIPAESIRDRESLLAACHLMAQRTFGLRSCFWNHRKLFRKLMERVEGRNQIIEQLAQIYERARYAPEHDLTQLEVERAQKLFTQVRGAAGASR